jgi:hypothetical protein
MFLATFQGCDMKPWEFREPAVYPPQPGPTTRIPMYPRSTLAVDNTPPWRDYKAKVAQYIKMWRESVEWSRIHGGPHMSSIAELDEASWAGEGRPLLDGSSLRDGSIVFHEVADSLDLASMPLPILGSTTRPRNGLVELPRAVEGDGEDKNDGEDKDDGEDEEPEPELVKEEPDMAYSTPAAHQPSPAAPQPDPVAPQPSLATPRAPLPVPREPRQQASPIPGVPPPPVSPYVFDSTLDAERVVRVLVSLVQRDGVLDAAARTMIEVSGGKWADLDEATRAKARLAALGALNGIVQFIASNSAGQT